MRIAITGTHGAGKTTLATLLAETLHLPLIREVARTTAFGMGYKSTADILAASKDRKANFQCEVLNNQLFDEFWHRGKGFISDRSVLDVIAYMRLYELDDMIPDLDNLEENAIDYAAKNYDLVLYLPLISDGPVADDGFRLTDKESQEKVDKWIRMMADQLPNGKIISEKTLEGRLRHALLLVADVVMAKEAAANA